MKIFILTSEFQDLKGRHVLRYFGHSPEDGAVELVFDRTQPVFFIEQDAVFPSLGVDFKRQPVSLRNFSFKPVDALYFSSYRDLKQAAETLRLQGVAAYESDIRPEDRFLMERFIFGQVQVEGDFEQAGGLKIFHQPKIKLLEKLEPQFSVASLDIETGVRDQSLYAIAVHFWNRQKEEKQVWVRVRDPLRPSADSVQFVDSEKALLTEWTAWLQEKDPDLLIGWNVVDFDLRFLQGKCRELHVPFKLGRAGREGFVRERSRRSGYFASIPGRVVVDGVHALRSAFYSFEDFKLETVAQKILGRGKLITSEQDKIQEIDRLFKEDPLGLARYNLEDAVLVSEIFQKTGLIELMTRRTQISGLLMNQIGMSTAAFDHFFLPHLHRQGFVAGDVQDVELNEHAAGGYVMEPKTGIHNHVLVFDFKSLYPSIIQTFKIDPLSRLMAAEDPVTTPNGYRFSKTRHILPDFIEKLLAKRAEAKKKKDPHLAQAIKILMNSFYGVMGSGGCRFYHPSLPTAITGTGQWLLLETKKVFESKGGEVLYGDTDSLFVQFPPEKMTHPDALGERLAAEINAYWKKRILLDFGVESYLEMEYEKYYKKCLLPRARGREGGAKKRYVGLQVQQGKESFEFVGMEAVRSDWTKLAKEFQQELYDRLFHDQDIKEWLQDYVKRLRQGALDARLIYQKNLRKDLDSYTKSTPPHVKAARLMKSPVRHIRYVMTRRGPVPADENPKDIDYDHYIEKQLKPIADSILGFSGESFDSLALKSQLELF